jgi:hypothetical protein
VLNFLQGYYESLKLVYCAFSILGQELLCNQHIRYLALLIGLKVTSLDFGTLLKQLVYIAGHVENHAHFKEALMGS